MAKRPSMPRPCYTGGGWHAAGASVDGCVRTRITFGVCGGESRVVGRAVGFRVALLQERASKI